MDINKVLNDLIHDVVNINFDSEVDGIRNIVECYNITPQELLDMGIYGEETMQEFFEEYPYYAIDYISDEDIERDKFLSNIKEQFNFTNEDIRKLIKNSTFQDIRNDYETSTKKISDAIITIYKNDILKIIDNNS